MRKFVSAFILFSLMFVLAACGGNSEGSTQTTSGSAGGETVKLRLAGQSPDDHPSTQDLYKFAEQVKEKTEGRVEIKVYPANQLGDYTTVFEEITHGTVEMGLISFPGELDPRLTLNFMPYLVLDYDELEEKLGQDSYVFNTVKDVSAEVGVEFLGYYANGFGGLGTAKEIKNLFDREKDKGVLIRTPAANVFKLGIEDLGFRTTTIPFADLYTALQTGAADGWLGGEASLNYTGFRDAIKNFYATRDFLNADALLINQNVFNKLSEADQATIKELSNELFKKSVETAQQNDEGYMNDLKEYGIEVVELSDEELSQLAETVRTETWPKLKSEFGDEIVDEMIKRYNP